VDSDEYEELVSRLASKLQSQMPALAGGAVAFGPTNRIEGASGYLHQIDVSVDTHAVLLLLECKYWQRPVDTVGMLAFCARHVDIKAKVNEQKNVMAALATINGFDPGAEQLAKFFAVELWHVLNENEFVCRVGCAVSVGVVDHLSFSDRVVATVQRGSS
jgi:hypothetical protein